MPLLLLVPLLLVVVLVLWALLLPFSLWQRYRMGHARRRAQGWVVRVNAWLLAVSVLLFVVTAWLSGHWMAHAFRDAVVGLCAGAGVGIIGLWLTRFERQDGQLFYTPHRGLVLMLTALVAARIALGLWLGWQRVSAPSSQALMVWLQAGGVIGVGGILLGYYLAYTWGLRARLRAEH